MNCVRQVPDEDHDSTIRIARTLVPSWLDEFGLEQIGKNLQTKRAQRPLSRRKRYDLLVR
jgi:hypothetical protein